MGETELVLCLLMLTPVKHQFFVLDILTICEDLSLIMSECLKLFLQLAHSS
jgi:hypothetical protein